jgi:hypothetical protein
MGLISLLKAVKPACEAIFEHNESDAITEQKKLPITALPAL